MNRGNFAALLHVLSLTAVITISFFTRTEPHWKGIAKQLGFFIFLLGMFLFVWALAHLREAFFGNIEPVGSKLVTTGPYKFVRHPVYLGMIVAILGLTIGLRSLWGLVGLLSTIPIAIYRARLEEKALARKFGEEWVNYSKRTYLMFPLLY